MASKSIGADPPQCPSSWASADFPYPSLEVLYLSMAGLSFFFAVAVFARYNSVKVLNTKVTSDIISNTPWIFYFLFFSIRCVFITVRYQFRHDSFDEWLETLCLMFQGMTVLTLTWALNFQLRFRSLTRENDKPIAKPEDTKRPPVASSSLSDNESSVLLPPFFSNPRPSYAQQIGRVASTSGAPSPIPKTQLRAESSSVPVSSPFIAPSPSPSPSPSPASSSGAPSSFADYYNSPGPSSANNSYGSYDAAYSVNTNANNTVASSFLDLGQMAPKQKQVLDPSVPLRPEHMVSKIDRVPFVLRCCASSSRKCGLFEVIYFFLFVLFMSSATVAFFDDNKTTEWISLVFYSLQQLPIFVLIFMVLFCNSETNDGPTRFAKAALVVAAICNVSNDLPISVWSTILPENCALKFASWVDVVHLGDALSIIGYFLFLRDEYRRNTEACLWKQYHRIQHAFDARM